MASTTDSPRSAMDHLPAPGGRGRGRLLPRTIIALCLLVVLVAGAPMLIAHSPLLGWVLSYGTSSLRGSLEVEGATLGWFSPIEVRQALLRDEHGGEVLTISHFKTEKSLLTLLGNWREPGLIRLEQPRLQWIVRADGSNLEDVLADLLHSDEPSSGPIGVTVEIVDGTLALRSDDGRYTAQIEHLDATLALPASPEQPLQLTAKGQVLGAGHARTSLAAVASSASQPAAPLTAIEPAPGDLQLALSFHPSSADAGVMGLQLDAQNVPLDVLQPLMPRWAPGYELAGRLTAAVRHEMHCTLPEASADNPIQFGGRGGIDARVQVDRLAMQGPAFGAERLHLARVEMQLRGSTTEQETRVEQLSVGCDAGQLACQAALPPPDRLYSAWSSGALAALVKGAAGRLDAKIDLAQLARIIPRTLRLREGVELRTGQVALAASSQPQPAGALWQASLKTSQLAALVDGQAVEWDDPLSVELTARETSAGFSLDELRASSDFLHVEGAGSPQQFTLRADCDLSRLAQRASQFVQLGGMRLAGQGRIAAQFSSPDLRQFQSSARLNVTNFECSLPGRQPWVEPRLDIDASATGLRENLSITRLDTATLSLVSGGDRFTATLPEPADLASAAARLPLDVQLQGQLATWLPRMEPAWALPLGWKLDGGIAAQARLVGLPQGIEVRQGAVDVDQFQLSGPGLLVREPRVQLRTEAGYAYDQRQLQLSGLTLHSQTLQVAADRLLASVAPDGALSLAGSARFAGDVGRLHAWMADPANPSAWRLAGQLEGQTQLDYSAGRIALDLESKIANLAAASAGGAPWQQRLVEIACRIQHQPLDDSLLVERAEIKAEALGINAKGKITELSTSRLLDCEGFLAYDLEQLQPLLQGYLGRGVRLSGRQSRPFRITGPLNNPTAAQPAGGFSLSAIRGQTELGWQAADIYGLQIAKTDLTGQLEGGIARLLPTAMQVNGGTLRLAPQLRLEPGPMELTHPPGKLVERVRVTPEMCNQGLMYIAPVLAGVAEAQGELSLDLDRCRMPLDNPNRLDAAGRLTVHSVEIGAGPLTRELAILLSRPSSARLKRESVVEFQVVDGRVYHRNLILEFPDLTIRTQGSVGLDQTLSLLAEMPIPPKWIGNNALGSALRDKVIQIPIGGTLERPQLDQRRVQELAAQVLRDAAGGAIFNELNRGLDRLLGPMGSNAPPAPLQ